MDLPSWNIAGIISTPPKKNKNTEQVFGNIPGSFQISKHLQPKIGSGWNLKVNFGTKTLHLELGCVFLIFYVHPYILEEDSQPEPILTFADFFEKGLKLNHQPLAIYKRELNPTLKGNNTSPRERSDPNHRLGKIRTVWSGRFRSTGTKSSEAMGWFGRSAPWTSTTSTWTTGTQTRGTKEKGGQLKLRWGLGDGIQFELFENGFETG